MSHIQVRYFASLRERMGRGEEQVEARDITTVADLWRRVSPEPMPANTLMAVNQEYATEDAPLRAGDEVAFFPPVTGG